MDRKRKQNAADDGTREIVVHVPSGTNGGGITHTVSVPDELWTDVIPYLHGALTFAAHNGSVRSLADSIPITPANKELIEQCRQIDRIVERQFLLFHAASASAQTAGLTAQQPPPSSAASFPRFWELFPIILDHETRERVYAPAVLDLLDDYVRLAPNYRTPLARAYLTTAFSFRTLLIVGQSLQQMVGERMWVRVLKWLPALITGLFLLEKLF
jgi:hypothetical protein